MKRTTVILGFVIIMAALMLTACQAPAATVVSANVQPQATAVPATTEAAPTTATEAPAAATEAPAEAAAPAPVSAEVMPLEQCTTCHKHTGSEHQAFYDSLYQVGVINVSGINYAYTAPSTHTVTFNLTKNGQPFDAAKLDGLSIYYVPYAEGKFQFEPALARLSLKGKVTCDAGKCTSVMTSEDEAYKTNLRTGAGLLTVTGYDETMGKLPSRIVMPRFVFAEMLTMGNVDYVSAANEDGCASCHTDPYLKHGNILARVNGDPATDFMTCKVCHTDNGAGGHFEWQLLVDDPKLAADVLAGKTELTDEQKAKYAYNTTVMNDVHMSHAMEFPYPQSMSNCVTCHEGKLDVVTSDAAMNIATCKSCHAAEGAVEKKGEETLYDTTLLSLKTIVPEAIHGSMDLATTDCASCHTEGGAAKPFSAIHSGYNKAIYAAPDLKYSDAIKVTIDEVAFADNTLNVKFSAAMDPEIEGVKPSDIVPTIIVNLYGWDTKDFIVSGHDRPFDDNGDGAIDNKDSRALEFAAGADHPRGKTVVSADGKWEMTVDLSKWADKLSDGTVNRVAIGVMPKLVINELPVAVDGLAVDFNLKANAIDKTNPPVTSAERCEDCHGALATEFHSPEYGGSIELCAMCHVTKTGGSHLEMQSRSLDSYVHAIHSGQPFDTDEIDFSNPVEKMHYEHHVEFPYPKHGTDCESCHLPGQHNLGDPAKYLPSLLSASNENESWGRKLDAEPAMVVGPATRVCGSCHKTRAINEDSNLKMELFKQHVLQNGYMIDAGEKPADTLSAVIAKFVELFK